MSCRNLSISSIRPSSLITLLFLPSARTLPKGPRASPIKGQSSPLPGSGSGAVSRLFVFRRFPDDPRSGLVEVLGRLAGLVRLTQVIRKRHAHGRLHIRPEGIPADRTALQASIGNQSRHGVGFLAQMGNLLFPDLASMVNGILRLFMWVVQLVKRFLVFHAPNAAPILSAAQGCPNSDCTTTWARVC